MKKRQWSILAAVVVLGLAFLTYNQLKTPPEKEALSRSVSARGVEVTEIQNGPVPLTIRVDGSLKATQKIELYAEVNGILQPGPKPFEAGVSYQKGQTLLSLNNTEARAAYEAQRNTYINTLARLLPDVKIDYPESYEQWYNYLNEITKSKKVPQPAIPQNDKLRLFLTGQGLYRDYQNLASSRERLSKYQIQAPFNGTLTEALVETGTLVRPGQPLGEFMAQDVFELEATVGSSQLAFIKIGDSVQLQNPEGTQSWQGTVSRINSKVNSSSLRVSVFIQVSGEYLQDGQFLTGTIQTQTIPKAAKVARNLVVQRNKLFVVADTVLRSVKLEIIHKSPETVVVTNLPNGTRVPKKPVPGAYSGMPVKIIKGQ